MTPEQWLLADQLFGEIQDLPDTNRAAAIAAIADGEVRAEVRSLLEHAAGAPLDDAIGKVVEAASSSGLLGEQPILPGERIGPYRIVRLLGHGGMGEVYEAAREDGFHKRVAIKVVRFGLQSEHSRQRFEYERQILAELEHPNIARLLDGGETANGSPYLALEYVEGVAIDDYCAARALPPARILALFLKVCEAVDYAHRNLIVHRDLKPSNILVTEGEQTKLLDFGIAKLMNPAASAAAAALTQTGSITLTPQYAAPEQVRRQNVTTATDVYMLGVVLYRLLAGHLPYDVTDRPPAEVDRLICELDPAPPGIDADLDNIVMMAIRKDPLRRYQSARELAEDVERYLADEPVRARPDGWAYRATKFVRRNRLAIGAGVAVAVALTAGIAVSQYQARRAARRFAEVRTLANRFLFDFDNAIAPLSGSTKAREMVVTTALEYLGKLSNDSAGDDALEGELAAAYEKVGDIQGSPFIASLGKREEALASYRTALAIEERRRNPEAARGLVAKAMKIGDILQRTGKIAEAKPIFAKAFAAAEKSLATAQSNDNYALMANACSRVADAHVNTGELKLGVETCRKCLASVDAWRKQAPGDRTQFAYAITQGRLSVALWRSGKVAEARDLMLEMQPVLSGFADAHPENAIYRRNFMVNLDHLAAIHGSPEELNLADSATAEKYYRRALALAETALAKDPNDALAHFDLAMTCRGLAGALATAAPEAMEPLARRALVEADVLLAKSPKQGQYRQLRAESLIALSRVSRASGRAAQADREAAEAEAILRPMLSEDATVSSALLSAIELQGKYAEALALAEPLSAKMPEETKLARKVAEYRAKR